MMSRDKLNIPKKLHIGFQNRQGTYTGKLAYITYTDEKGKHRKQKSWDTWRDHSIAVKNIDNEPIDGFVLNKKVGETRYGWNPRKAWVRVYDPRDFEFEISVANLLFILEECSAIKGKGLEGEFVYAWDGTELVLLPTSSQEYTASKEFTSLQTKKVTKKDMREGCLYVNKDNQQIMYLGRHDWYEKIWSYSSAYHSSAYHHQIKHSKQHVFVSVDGQSNYWIQKGFTKLAKKLGDDPSPLFPSEFEKFKKSIHGSAPVKIVGTPEKLNLDKASWRRQQQQSYIKKKGKFYPVVVGIATLYPQIAHSWNQTWETRHATREAGKREIYFKAVSRDPIIVDANGYIHSEFLQMRGSDSEYARYETTKEELEKLKLYNVFIENEQGARISV